MEQTLKKFEYDAVLHEEPDGGAYVVFPWNIREVFGKGRVKVRAEFDGIPYDGSIVNMGVKDENGLKPVKGGRIQNPAPVSRRKILRIVLLIAAVCLLAAGCFNGSAKDVLGKAVNVCTECIGLG